nr:unnamed protein product [Digitaria exilis]
MSIPIPTGVLHPCGSLSTDFRGNPDYRMPAAMRRSIPNPPVSAAATLSCAAAAATTGSKEADGVDRISALPDDLLRRVLARLPAKDGACTAMLSTRWLGLWRSAPLSLIVTTIDI